MTNVHGVVILALWPSGSLHIFRPTELVGSRMRNYIKPIKAWRKQTSAEREKYRLLWTLSFAQRLWVHKIACGHAEITRTKIYFHPSTTPLRPGQHPCPRFRI